MSTLPEAVDNANSIADIPAREFPDLAAKFHLMIRALNGEDVYAYHPHGSDAWVLWIRSSNPAHDDRWSIQKYCEQFNLERETEKENVGEIDGGVAG